MATSYRELEVWRRSIDLAEDCYAVTARFPQSELYGLVNQIRRASTSIPANLAEGNSRCSLKAYLNHVHVALGSHGELRTLLDLGGRLGFITPVDRVRLTERLDEVGRMLSGLRTALRRRIESRP